MAIRLSDYRPWDPSKRHPVVFASGPRRPLVERIGDECGLELLAHLHAPWPEAVTDVRIDDGLLIFEFD